MKKYAIYFVRDHLSAICIALASLFILNLFLFAFRIPPTLEIFINIFLVATYIIILIVEYFKRARFYNTLCRHFGQLDQKYLITETLERPNFLDGQILYDVIYETDKSMREEITKNSATLDDFCDYLELWIHEAKTPISAISLLNRDANITAELTTLDNYLEQILYFTRSKNANQDYLFNSFKLSQIIERVLEKNRVILQKKQISLQVSNLDTKVSTDAKWLEFIINQILQNSIKYGAKNIKIYAEKSSNDTLLNIVDDGIGISTKDLPRVFEKSFTGQNGRKFSSTYSTGMGLHIVKNLCTKLGHDIEIISTDKTSAPAGSHLPNHSGTSVIITFHDHDYYKNVISA